MPTKFITQYDEYGNPYLVPVEGEEGQDDPYGLFSTQPTTRIVVNPLDVRKPVGTPQAPGETDQDLPYGSANIPRQVEVPRGYEDVLGEAEAQQTPVAHPELAPEERPESALDRLEKLTRSTRQLVKGGAAAALSLPWELGALATDIGPQAATFGMAPRTDTQNDVSAYLRKHGAQARQGVADLLGVESEPTNLIDQAYSGLGASLTPMKGMTAAATGIVATGKAGGEAINSLFPSAQAQPTQQELPPPNSTPIQTVGGNTWIDNAELKAVGALAAVTIGMVFGPKVYARFKSGDVPRFRQVREAVPGTVAISKPRDYARTFDDANAGAVNILRRSGVDPAAAQVVEDALRIQTRATANAMAESAINTGRMVTPAFTFQSRVPLAELAKLETLQTTQYVRVLQIIEDIKTLSLGSTRANQPASVRSPVRAGPISVRGMDLAQASALKRAIEQAHPEAVGFSTALNEILQATRKFMAAGEHATMSKAQYRYLNAQRKSSLARTITEDIPEGSVAEEMGRYMQAALRQRMENEAVGLYVDAVRRSTRYAQAKDMFRPISNEQWKQHPKWHKRSVEFYRRGNKERYTTDILLAGVLRMDPYALGQVGNITYALKRAIEVTTTGELAPWFAPTSMIRNHALAAQSAEAGMKAPWFFQTAAAIPQQLYPQLANVVSQSLERGSGQWLNKVFGQGTTDALATRLAYHYVNSIQFQLATVGGGRGSILQHQTPANWQASQVVQGQRRALTRLGQAIETTQGAARAALEGYRAVLNSVHNAAQFAYAVRNYGKVPLPQLGEKVRNITGDPRIGGKYLTKAPGSDRAVPIRFEDTESRVSHTFGLLKYQHVANAFKPYGWVTEHLGRNSIPWYNATVQGIKRIGQSYLEDPAKFTMRAWLYQIAPTASFYLATKSLGNDPNGVSYSDYERNRRSEYNKTMNLYVPIPGRPAEDGIEVPMFHEGAPFRSLTSIAMDHAFRTNIFDESEDLKKAASNVAGVIFEPNIPVWNLALASVGMVASGGVFSGEPYRAKNEPFDQLGGMPKSIEMYVRAIWPGLADVVGQGYAAFVQTPDGFAKGLKNAATATGRRVIEKTPIARDVFDIKPPMSGNNRVSEELFARKKVIDELERFYREWTAHQGLIGVTTRKGQLVPMEGRSIEGSAMAQERMGDRPPVESLGLNQPPPTNPLYNMFIEELHNKFVKDAPYLKTSGEYDIAKPTGAIGMQSLWQRYSLATRHLNRLKKVNDGNLVTWQEQLEGREGAKAYLKANGFAEQDMKEPRKVRNFLERQRQDAARVILFTIRETEKEMSMLAGRPIKLEDIRPYGKGLESEAVGAEGYGEQPISGGLMPIAQPDLQ